MQQIAELEHRLDNVESSLEELQQQDHTITVREAMGILEDYIVLDIMETKSQIKKTGLINISRIKDKLNPKYLSFLQKNRLSEDDMLMFDYLKGRGNSVVHDQRPSTSYEDLRQMAAEDDDDPADQLSKTRLLDLLKQYVPSAETLSSPLETKRPPPRKPQRVIITSDNNNTSV